MHMGQRFKCRTKEHTQMENKLMKKMLNMASHWGNAHLSHKEKSLHIPRKSKVK